MKNKIVSIGFICVAAVGCSQPSQETHNISNAIKSSFPEALVITSQDEKVLDYQVMLSSDFFPTEEEIVKFFTDTNQSLYMLSVSQELMQASINFGIPSEGILYRMDCINQGIGLCDLGKGTLPNLTTLKSSHYE